MILVKSQNDLCYSVLQVLSGYSSGFSGFGVFSFSLSLANSCFITIGRLPEGIYPSFACITLSIVGSFAFWFFFAFSPFLPSAFRLPLPPAPIDFYFFISHSSFLKLSRAFFCYHGPDSLPLFYFLFPVPNLKYILTLY